MKRPRNEPKEERKIRKKAKENYNEKSVSNSPVMISRGAMKSLTGKTSR